MLTPLEYEFRTKPFAHQREVFHATANRRAFGLFWEVGCGKSKVVIDTAAYLYGNGLIDTVVVIAPNGVHRNWLTDEIPAHMPKGLAKVTSMMYWQSKRANTKTHKAQVTILAKHKGLRVLAMNYEAILTKKGLAALVSLMKGRQVLLVFDESHYIKTPGVRRTKRSIALAKKAAYVRILTGTPIANSPFDAYSQLRALQADYWKQFNFSVFSTFKTHFGIFTQGYNTAQEREFKTCVGYRRLDQLKKMIDPMCSRVTKDEVLDLPPRLYQRRFFEMTPEQKKVYDQIKHEAMALLDSGDTVTAPLAITRLLRLQQVTCGYVPTDEGTPEFETFGDINPRLDLLIEICDTLSHPAIIWARFRRDIDLIMERLGKRAVRYDGKTSDDERAEAKRRFQARDVQFFVGNPAAGATGLTLTAARTVIYASNSFKLTDRLQSEGRPHRIGQEHPVVYIDLIAPGTIDEYIVAALRNKRDIASELTGDELKEWI